MQSKSPIVHAGISHTKKNAGAHPQHGISLMIVLIALVVMSLAAVGLIRMVDTGTLIVGNVAFKQSTTSSADAGVERAIVWLQANNSGSSLFNNNQSVGYYATSLDELDISGNATRSTRVLVDWNDDNCAYASSGSYALCIKPASGDSNNGYVTKYIITRMCRSSGDPGATGNSCAKPVASSSSQSPKRGELKYGEDKRFDSVAGPYFRIAVRATGPRATLSYTETYVHF